MTQDESVFVNIIIVLLVFITRQGEIYWEVARTENL